ncbi:MAG: hypothetical protein AB1566_00535 [Chloroflexota bacterium]
MKDVLQTWLAQGDYAAVSCSVAGDEHVSSRLLSLTYVADDLLA